MTILVETRLRIRETIIQRLETIVKQEIPIRDLRIALVIETMITITDDQILLETTVVAQEDQVSHREVQVAHLEIRAHLLVALALQEARVHQEAQALQEVQVHREVPGLQEVLDRLEVQVTNQEAEDKSHHHFKKLYR